MSSGREVKSSATPVLGRTFGPIAKPIRESHFDYLPSIRWVPVLIGMHFLGLGAAVYMILFS